MFFSIKNTSGFCEQNVSFVWPVLGAGRAGRVGWLCQGDSHTFVVVVPDGLGVLVPEVVVHDHVQPLGVEVHVPLGVRLQVVDMKVLSLLDDPVMVVQGGGLLQVAAARVDDCLLDRVVRGVGELLGQGEGVLGGGRVVAVPGGAVRLLQVLGAAATTGKHRGSPSCEGSWCRTGVWGEPELSSTGEPCSPLMCVTDGEELGRCQPYNLFRLCYLNNRVCLVWFL